MDCQHCEKGFSDLAEFEEHTSWHTERQTELRREVSRKYSITRRSPSSSTNQSTSSRSNGSTPNPPDSTTTVDSPSSSSKKDPRDRNPSAFTEANVPAFDFDFGTISPSTPLASPSVPTIKSLEDVVARFPAFEIEEAPVQAQVCREYKCAECDAFFSTQKDCDLHNQSRFCPGTAAVAFALYRDLRQPGGYRVDKKYLPFNAYQSRIKCPKCELTFANRLSKKVHERNHVKGELACLHCQKIFYTKAEIEAHYEWHDDMEYRHHRDRCRRKLPGLKLQSKTPDNGLLRTGVSDFGRKSVLLANEDLTAVPEESTSERMEQPTNFEQEEEPIAISFVSSEDLERIHAPNGVFRDLEPRFLNSQRESRPDSVEHALDSLEGRSAENPPPSPVTATSVNKEDSAENREPQSPRPKLPQKRSSVRALFRRSKSETQLESNVKKVSSFRRTLRRDSISDEAVMFDGRLTLNAILHRVSTAANKGDLKSIRRECDRLMALKLPTTTDSGTEVVPVQAFCLPEGTLVQDAAGNQRYISSEIVNEITSGLRRLPVATLAKAKVSVLSTRAYLSTQERDFEDAFWCYRQVIDLLREQPMLFPDIIWQAAILSNLAHLAARLDRPNEEEKYLLKALAISYHRYGRDDLNNINFLRTLAAAYERRGQTGRAAEVYKRSLFARMTISGPRDRSTWMAMQDLAAIYGRLGRLTTARFLYEQCLGGFEVQLGLEHKVTLLIVDRLCDVYIQQQSYDEALALYARAFPHLHNVFGRDDDLPRTWVSRYIQHAENLDLPPTISEFLQHYRVNSSEENLLVMQGLARVYLLAGLNADAAEIFDFVYNTRVRLQQGELSSVNLDALHGHCLALECMDQLDAAHSSYVNLIQLAVRSRDVERGRFRAMNLNNRVIALQERKEILAGEQDAWNLGKSSTGPCTMCRYQTTRLCPRCQIARFCCEACQDLAARLHEPACHPSVTLCQSKSVTAVTGVPQRIEREVLDRLSRQDMRHGGKATLHRVTNTFTLSFDPRNLTTFRIKFNSAVDTFVSFDRDADIRIAVVDASASNSKLSPLKQSTTTSAASTNLDLKNNSKVGNDNGSTPPFSPTSSILDDGDQDANQPDSNTPPMSTSTGKRLSWTDPSLTPTLFIPKAKASTTTTVTTTSKQPRPVYLVVAPGPTIFQTLLDRRRKIRRGDCAHWEAEARFAYPSPSSSSPLGRLNRVPTSASSISSSSASISSPSSPSSPSSSSPPSSNMTVKKNEKQQQNTNKKKAASSVTMVPNQAMVEYAQGLVLDAGPAQKTRFAYMVEVGG